MRLLHSAITCVSMEEMKMNAGSMQRPIKTEWNSRCVIFTYFQGDISSVVDEHFSRALSNIKNPQELSPLSQSEDVVLRNDIDMPPNQWRFSSQWTKPEPEVSFADGAASCSMNGFDPMAMDEYSLPLPGSSSVQPGELWHFSSPASPSSPEPDFDYPHAFSAEQLFAEDQPDEKHGPLLSVLQQDRCVAHRQQLDMWENCDSAQIAGSMGFPFNLPSSPGHCKKRYFPPDRGPASTSLASERTQSSEKKDLFFY
ncbi:PREDICTED: transcription cofactor vestigial-like protein 1 isoform X2 [Hipposideros armiger]|uniref:Transcription cofactor vestigial-like protein 1 isoform X2 n=1 Tax=Hipposideros armiger TaxID=186990 RepID=A0A8B7TC65_HIPAR|nr:PREDICTED: transcription cofactor vestigial-like protein 1 isoform X2 [Hipposideros armiger]